MANNQEQNEIELHMIEMQYWVEQKEALERLENNPDFKAVILEGYFKDRVLDGVSLLANDEIKRSGQRTEIMERLVAISTLQDHFAMLKNLGTVAKDEIVESDEDIIDTDEE